MTPRWIFWRRTAGFPGDLSCRELVELVTAYLEDALGERDRARFEAHIAGCEHCTAYVAQMRDTIRLVGEIEPDGLPGEMERDLLAAFRDWKAGDGA